MLISGFGDFESITGGASAFFNNNRVRTMYSDPTKIRSHVVKLRFSDEEHALIQALSDYTGEQKAALLRYLVMAQASSVLRLQDSDRAHRNEGTLKALMAY